MILGRLTRLLRIVKFLELSCADLEQIKLVTKEEEARVKSQRIKRKKRRFFKGFCCCNCKEGKEDLKKKPSTDKLSRIYAKQDSSSKNKKDPKSPTDVLKNRRLSNMVQRDLFSKRPTPQPQNNLKKQPKKFFNFIKKSIPKEKLIFNKSSNYLLKNLKNNLVFLMPKKSKAGIVWMNVTIKKMIYLILLFNILLSFFNKSFYTSSIQPWESDLKTIRLLYQQENLKEDLLSSFLDNMRTKYEGFDYQVVELKFSNKFFSYENQNLKNKIRKIQKIIVESEFKKTSIEGVEEPVTLSLQLTSKKRNVIIVITRLASLTMNIVMILIFFISIKTDSKRFILDPLSKITSIINTFLYEPLNENCNLLYLNPEKRRKIEGLDEEGHQIIAIALMRIFYYYNCCFGSSSMSFISQNMAIGEGRLQECEGSKVSAYFALLEIKDLTEIVEKKRNKSHIFSYISDIFNIVSCTSDRFFGSSYYQGRNQFFIIWKLEEQDSPTNFNKTKTNRNSSEVASLSLTGLLKLFAKIDKIRRKKIKNGKENFFDYITTSFHAGQVYEYLAGSRHKLDFCYSGRQINRLKILHEFARKSNSALLVSETVFNILPECMKFECRLIDVIKFDLLEKPVNLYCMDITNERLRSIPPPLSSREINDVYEIRKIHCQIKSRINERMEKGAKNSMFLEDSEIKVMFNHNLMFRRNYRKAVSFYKLGAWDSALQFLLKCLEEKADDGPSVNLFRYMEKFEFKKPRNWRGYHRHYCIM